MKKNYEFIDRIVVKTTDEDISIDGVDDNILWIKYIKRRKGYLIKCEKQDIFIADSIIKSIIVQRKKWPLTGCVCV